MRPVVIILLLLWIGVPGIAQDRKLAITDAFARLADRDASVRQLAKEELMGLKPDELDLLRQVVSARTPLRLAQVDPLHEIVRYIRVRAALDKLPKSPGGFLGVSLPNLAIENEDQRPAGVPIVSRLQGFVAYRLLQDGDIITAIGPEKEMLPVYTPDQLRLIVRNFAAGQEIHLRIIRGTQPLTIRFPLDAPVASGDLELGVQSDINDAEYDAEQYWQKTFAPLLNAQAM